MKSKTISKAIESLEAQVLMARGLNLVSTARQIENGTIALSGKIRNTMVSLKITATGAVLSNEYVARTVFEATPLKQYKAGFRAADELLAKRFA